LHHTAARGIDAPDSEHVGPSPRGTAHQHADDESISERMNIERRSTTHQLLTSISAALLISGCGGADSEDPDSMTEQVQSSLVVGNGIVTSCTEAAFTAALAAGGIVTFDCGGPATIILTSRKSVPNTVTVDGGTSITLSSNAQSSLFDVTTAGSLTLEDITLEHASGTAITNHGTTSPRTRALVAPSSTPASCLCPAVSSPTTTRAPEVGSSSAMNPDWSVLPLSIPRSSISTRPHLTAGA